MGFLSISVLGVSNLTIADKQLKMNHSAYAWLLVLGMWFFFYLGSWPQEGGWRTVQIQLGFGLGFGLGLGLALALASRRRVMHCVNPPAAACINAVQPRDIKSRHKSNLPMTHVLKQPTLEESRMTVTGTAKYMTHVLKQPT